MMFGRRLSCHHIRTLQEVESSNIVGVFSFKRVVGKVAFVLSPRFNVFGSLVGPYNRKFSESVKFRWEYLRDWIFMPDIISPGFQPSSSIMWRRSSIIKLKIVTNDYYVMVLRERGKGRWMLGSPNIPCEIDKCSSDFFICYT